jgi:hypothetical protein
MGRLLEAEVSMLALTWSGWAGVVVAVLVGLFALMFAANRSWRRSVREELVEYLQAHVPDVTVAAVHPDRLELRWAGAGEGDGATFNLARIYQQLAAVREPDEASALAARNEIFQVVVKTLRDAMKGLDGIDAGAEHANVMPRLMADADVASYRAQMAPSGKTLPSLPSGVDGLSIVFVLDRETAVAYLTDELLAKLALTPAQALDLARTNLARTFARDVVRDAVASNNVNVIKSCDTFDAARLLLVPGYLEPGESLVALVPDRDTLVLTGPPADGDWTGLRKLARVADGAPLCAEPLVVTAEGIAKAA